MVTVLAGAPEAVVLDRAAPVAAPDPAAGGAVSLGGLLARDPGLFVGRRREQRTLPPALLAPGAAGLVLHGLGGIGKTTLAAEILRRAVALEPGRDLAVLTGPVTADSILTP